jgi:hypothetical protein
MTHPFATNDRIVSPRYTIHSTENEVDFRKKSWGKLVNFKKIVKHAGARIIGKILFKTQRLKIGRVFQVLVHQSMERKDIIAKII